MQLKNISQMIQIYHCHLLPQKENPIPQLTSSVLAMDQQYCCCPAERRTLVMVEWALGSTSSGLYHKTFCEVINTNRVIPCQPAIQVTSSYVIPDSYMTRMDKERYPLSKRRCTNTKGEVSPLWRSYSRTCSAAVVLFMQNFKNQ